MTLLVFTPTIGDGPHSETLRSVGQQSYTDYVHEVSYHNPYSGEKNRNVVAQYQRAFEMARAGGYEALLTVEHDMVLPPDALEKLVATDAPVVFGVYMLRHGTHTLSAWQYISKTNMGMSLSLYPDELKKAWKQGWWEVSGVGWGCTLIRRNVFETITPRQNDGDAGDLAFAADCMRAGHKLIARFDVPCLHIEPSGNVLDPRDYGGMVIRVLALQTFVAGVGNGQSMPMKKDRYYTVSPTVGYDLQRAGYVKITNMPESGEEFGEVDQPDITAREMAVNPKAATRSKRKNAIS
jgi:hypothetical protein